MFSQTLTTHYTVPITETNANVTFTAGNFTIWYRKCCSKSDLPNTQPTNYQNNTALDAETLKHHLTVVMQTQQITSNDRATKFADDVLGVDSDATEISTGGTDRVNKILVLMQAVIFLLPLNLELIVVINNINSIC